MKQNQYLAVFLFGAAALAAYQASAEANPQCAPRALVLERLSDGYDETRQSIGLGTGGAVVETFASSETGTWTITVTNTQGITCLIAAGQAFETLTEALPAKGTDT